MTPYVIFTFDTYYPGGGWSDFYARFATSDEAFLQIALDHLGYEKDSYSPYDNWEVVNVLTGEYILP